MKNVSPHKFKKTVLNTFKYIAKNGVDKNILSEYKKSQLLKLYDENTNYQIITNRIGRSEIINGDYHFYNKTFDLLENLSNEDIKRVVNTYLIENNMYMVELDVNLQKKTWYRQISSYIIHSTIWRIWNPFIEEF
jgi:predicted Zn-dependent peptidase